MKYNRDAGSQHIVQKIIEEIHIRKPWNITVMSLIFLQFAFPCSFSIFLIIYFHTKKYMHQYTNKINYKFLKFIVPLSIIVICKPCTYFFFFFFFAN